MVGFHFNMLYRQTERFLNGRHFIVVVLGWNHVIWRLAIRVDVVI